MVGSHTLQVLRRKRKFKSLIFIGKKKGLISAQTTFIQMALGQEGFAVVTIAALHHTALPWQ